MTIRYRTKGFVFKKNDRHESDRIFSVFTYDFGRVEVTAKAIRKSTSKLRSGIDVFYLSEVEFIQGKNGKTLTDAIVVKKFNSPILDYRKLEVLCRIVEVLDLFIKGQEKDEAVFDLLNEMFDILSNQKVVFKNHNLIFQYFFWNFISLQGYRIQTKNCASCQEKLNPCRVYFSGKYGGVICGSCASEKKTHSKPCLLINADIVKVLRLILEKDCITTSKLKVEPFSQNLLEVVSKEAVSEFCS